MGPDLPHGTCPPGSDRGAWPRALSGGRLRAEGPQEDVKWLRRRETRTPFLHTLFRGGDDALLITFASLQIGHSYRIEESD